MIRPPAKPLKKLPMERSLTFSQVSRIFIESRMVSEFMSGLKSAVRQAEACATRYLFKARLSNEERREYQEKSGLKVHDTAD